MRMSMHQVWRRAIALAFLGALVWASAPAPALAQTVPAQTTITVNPGFTILSVSWTLPNDGGSAIDGYDVEYKLASASSWTDAGHSGTGRSRTISSLTNYVTYD